MLLVGLTGSIATGKSTVSRLFQNKGIPVIDADRISHEVVATGRPAFYAVLEAFPRALNGQTGDLDRKALGNLVFGDPAARKKLNAILHPLIQLEMALGVLWEFLSLSPLVILDAPLLFEVHLHRFVHKTLVVYWFVLSLPCSK
jgi:dephospho-CoA kinase